MKNPQLLLLLENSSSSREKRKLGEGIKVVIKCGGFLLEGSLRISLGDLNWPEGIL